MVRVMNRLPEVVDRLSAILAKIDGVLGDVRTMQIPEHLASTLEKTDRLLGEASLKLDKLDTGKLSKEAEKTLQRLNQTVAQLSGLLGRIGSDKGLLASALRASDAFGDTVRATDGLGGQLEEALGSVQDAAKSIQKLADSLQRNPDMLLKGRDRSAEKNR